MRIATIIAVLAAALPNVPLMAATGPAETQSRHPTTRRPSIKAILASSCRPGGPGIAAIVTRRGETLLLDSCGLADIAAGRAIRPTDRFHLASITKMLTAATVTRLAEQGKLSLDDPLSKYLPGFPPPSDRATIRQLLNHSSGVHDITKVPGWMAANAGHAFTTAQLVNAIRALKPGAEPGEEWEYNNGGYVLLGAIIEKVTGEKWADAVRDEIAEPLHLQSIGTGRTSVRGYGGNGPDAPVHELADTSVAGAAGGLVGDVRDLATFVSALHHGKLLGDGYHAQLVAPAELNDGRKASYAFGFRIGRLRGSPTYYQGGAMRGARTETLYLPREDIFVAVLANSDSPLASPRPLAQRLAAEAMGQPFPVFSEQLPDLKALEPLFGRYGSGEQSFLFFERGGQLLLAPQGSSARPVRYAGDSTFFFNVEDGDWFEVDAMADGMQALRFHDSGSSDARIFPKSAEQAAANPAIDPGPLASAPGTYRVETGTVLAVVADGSTLALERGGKRIGSLRPLGDDKLAIDGTPMQLEFIREGGKITGFRLHRGARTLTASRLRDER